MPQTAEKFEVAHTAEWVIVPLSPWNCKLTQTLGHCREFLLQEKMKWFCDVCVCSMANSDLTVSTMLIHPKRQRLHWRENFTLRFVSKWRSRGIYYLRHPWYKFVEAVSFFLIIILCCITAWTWHAWKFP